MAQTTREQHRDALRKDGREAFTRDGQRPLEAFDLPSLVGTVHTAEDRARADREMVGYRARHDRRTEATPSGAIPAKGN